MSKMPPEVFDYPDLLSAPVRRAAYSDRTAWLMASMSELAYWPHEGGEDKLQVVLDLVLAARGKNMDKKTDEEACRDVKKRLNKFLKISGNSAADSRKALEESLSAAGFILDATYNISETQGFLCHRLGDAQNGGMRILAFRGTEPNLKDFKTDLRATLVPAKGGDSSDLIHEGFQDSFDDIKTLVETDLEQNQELPLYVTGHSLGGGLSIVATWSIAASSLGACYTFGGPRVGNMALSRRFKTPIYRIVNCSDIVPRVPPSWVFALITLLKFVPLPVGWLIGQLSRWSGYVHFGDMRFLTHTKPNEVQGLLSNPGFLSRLFLVVPRWINTWGKAGIDDHSISLYRLKLKAYATQKNMNTKTKVLS